MDKVLGTHADPTMMQSSGNTNVKQTQRNEILSDRFGYLLDNLRARYDATAIFIGAVVEQDDYATS